MEDSSFYTSPNQSQYKGKSIPLLNQEPQEIEACTAKYFSCHKRLTEINNLSAGMVHELRNSLTSILITLEHFKNLDLGDSSQKRLEIALAESHHLNALASGILSYSKHQHLQIEWLDLKQLIQNVLAEAFISQISQGKQFHFECESESILAKLDHEQCQQALIQLLTNALEAIQVGQTIFCKLYQQDSQAKFEIRNVTHSVAPEGIQQWIQPFYSTKENGTGLGLMIAKRNLEANGGTLEISSDCPQVVCVSAMFPLQEEVSPFTARQLASQSSRSRPHASIIQSSHRSSSLVTAS